MDSIRRLKEELKKNEAELAEVEKKEYHSALASFLLFSYSYAQKPVCFTVEFFAFSWASLRSPSYAQKAAYFTADVQKNLPERFPPNKRKRSGFFIFHCKNGLFLGVGKQTEKGA